MKHCILVRQFVGRVIGVNTNQGEIRTVGKIIRQVNKARHFGPEWDGCASIPIREQEYFWVAYKGKRYPVYMPTPGVWTLTLAGPITGKAIR